MATIKETRPSDVEAPQTFSKVRSFGPKLLDMGVCVHDFGIYVIYVTGKTSFRSIEQIRKTLWQFKTKYTTDDYEERPIHLLSIYEWIHYKDMIKDIFDVSKKRTLTIFKHSIPFMLSPLFPRKNFEKIIKEVEWIVFFQLETTPILIHPMDYVRYKLDLCAFKNLDMTIDLLSCGDIEANPGPKINVAETIRKKIERMSNRRRKQLYLSKKTNYKDQNLQKKKHEIDLQFNVLEFLGLKTDVTDQASMFLDQLQALLPGVAAQYHFTLSEAQDTIKTIQQCAEKINSDDNILGSLINTKTNSISNAAILITVLVIFTLAYKGYYMLSGGILLCLLYFKFPKCVLEKIQTILGKMYEEKIELQMNMQECVNFIPMVGQIVFTILAFVGVGSIPHDRFYDTLLKRLDTVPKSVKGALSIWDSAGQVFNIVEKEFKVYVLRQNREDVYKDDEVTLQIKQAVQRIEHYQQYTNKRDLEKDSAAVDEIEKLYTQFYRWQFDLPTWKNLSADNQRIILQIKPTVVELHKLACQSSVHEGGFRKKPIVILFTGDSQIGKSFITVPMAIALLKERGYTDMEQIMHEIYFRCAETEYINGFLNPKICIYDDFGQIRDLAGKPNPEFFEAIRFANDMPASIHAAAMHEKNRFFGSEVLMFTSNIEKNFSNYIASVVCPSAVLNRFELAFRTKVHPNFQLKVKDSTGKLHIKLDKTKCGKNPDGSFRCTACSTHPTKIHGFCPHIYLFDKYNPLNDKVEQANMTAKEVFDCICAADKVNRFESSDKLAFYKWLAANDYDFQMNPLEQSDISSKQYDRQTFNIDNSDYNFVDEIISEEFDLTREIFYDAGAEYPSDGAVDLGNPWDAHQVHLLCQFVKSMEFVGVTSPDDILRNLAMYPDLYSIYSRRINFGIKGSEAQVNELLIDQMNNMDYDLEIRSFVKQPWTEILAKKLKKIKEQTSNILKNPIFQLCSMVGLVIGAIALVYKFSTPKEQAQIVVENSSAYVPQKKPQIVIENSSAYIPQKKPQIVVEDTPITVESYIDQNCCDIEDTIIKHNLYNMHTDKQQLGNALFIGGTTLLFNKHYLDSFSARDERVIHLSNVYGARLCSFNSHDIIDDAVILMKNNLPTDACIVKLDPIKSKVYSHKNIINKFIKTADLSKMPDKYAAQMPTFGGTRLDTPSISKRSLLDCKMAKDLIHVQQDVGGVFYDTYFNHHWTYACSTIFGDCGAPIIINSPYVVRKIVGIHSGAQSGRSLGYAQTITQEMLLEAMKDEFTLEYDLQSVPMNENVPSQGLIEIGQAEYKVVSPSVTKIIPSPLTDFREPITKPAHLRRGAHGNPMHLGLSKFCKETPLVDHKLINIVTEDYNNIQEINPSRKDRNAYARVLTWEECVKGIEGDEFIAPINRSTSMGYPYVQKYPSCNGKRDAFGNDEFLLDTPLAKQIKLDCDRLEQDCREGIIRDVFWTDTLKDERRPIEKVDQGKTRVFCAGPIHFTLVYRKYFLGYFAWLMHNRNFNGIACGTNVYSEDWNDIAVELKSKGFHKDHTNVIAGDYSNFDGSLLSQLLWSDLENANNFYSLGKDPKECEMDNKIRRTLHQHIVNAVHICGDSVFQVTHGQPSGCPGTAINNSKYGQKLVRINYLMIINDALEYCYGRNSQYPWQFEINSEIIRFLHSINNMKGYNKYIKEITYGDDNLIGVAEVIVDLFNQETVTFFMAILGHTYTDEEKSGKSYKIRDLSEVKFLKRKFVFDKELGRYIAPLDLDVVLEICQWTKKGAQEQTITTSNVDVTMRELSLHPLKVFNKWKHLIRTECVQKGIDYQFLTQREYRDMVLTNTLGIKLEH